MSENTNNRIVDLLYPFLDPIDRVSDKTNNQEYGITDNPHLFTGEACLLVKKLYGRLTFMETLYISANILDCTINEGLYSRHPEELVKKYKIPYNRVSHDEYNGLCFMAHSDFDKLSFIVNNIIGYGQHYDWMYDDRIGEIPWIEDNNTFFEYFKSDKKLALKQLWVYVKDYINNPQDTNSVDLRHPANITSLFSWRQPRDRAFYFITARRKPSVLDLAWLCLAIVMTSFRRIDKKKRGGTILMAWFRNIVITDVIALKVLPEWVNKPLSWSVKFFKFMMKLKYGSKYPVTLATAYFDRKDDNGNRHRMIDLVEKAVDSYPNL